MKFSCFVDEKVKFKWILGHTSYFGWSLPIHWAHLLRNELHLIETTSKDKNCRFVWKSAEQFWDLWLINIRKNIWGKIYKSYSTTNWKMSENILENILTSNPLTQNNFEFTLKTKNACVIVFMIRFHFVGKNFIKSFYWWSILFRNGMLNTTFEFIFSYY